MLTLALSITLWMRSDGQRTRAALAGLDAVASVTRDDESSPSGVVLRVEIDPSAGEAEVQEAIEAIYAVIDDGLAHSANISTGSAGVHVHPLARFRADTADAAEFLALFSDWEDGRVVLNEQDVAVVDTSLSPMENALDVLATVEGARFALEWITVEDEDGWTGLSINQLEHGHREFLEALLPWEKSIESIEIEASWTILHTSLDLDRTGPLAEAARNAAASLDADSSQVSIETPDERSLHIGDEAPGLALEMIDALEGAGWSVRSVGSERLSVDVSTAQPGPTSPSQLPDLAAALRSAGLPDDARVRVDGGVLFEGSFTELEELAPALADARAAGYVVRWTREAWGDGFRTHVRVEMPRGHVLEDDSDLKEALRTARSVPWPGSGSVTVRTTPLSEQDDVEAVTVESTSTGHAEEVRVDEAPGMQDQAVRDAWDATAA